MAVCQLAFPLVLPNFHSNEQMFLLGAMRLLNLNANTQSAGAHNMNLIDIPSPIVSAIRIGDLSKSKSRLLNDVICNHPHGIFFHKDCQAGNLTRKLSNGVIELAWFLPGGSKEDKEDKEDNFENVMALANMRGDVKNHSMQFDFLTKLSSVMLVFVSSLSKSDHECSSILKKLSTSNQQIIFVFYDEVSQRSLIDLKKQMGSKAFKFVLGSVKGHVKNAALITNELRKKIKDSIKKHQGTEINKQNLHWEAISDIAFGVGIKVDEDNEHYTNGKIMANTLIDKLHLENVTTIKNEVVPLQGTFWSNWSSLTKKQARLDGVSANGHENYISDIISKKNSCRREQCNLIDKMNPVMRGFIQFLIKTKDNPESRISFMQCMKFKLDINSHRNLPELQRKYCHLWNDLQEQNNKKNDNAEKQLLKVERDLIASSFGLEHFMRELGQVYEAVTECKSYSSHKFKTLHLLPQIAADLLLSGFPLEIMDGDVAHMPLTWVKAVFNSLKSVLGDKRLYVISVLGVQSSGKSTLLNTMFGLNFAVSAGRCTKGVFAQLIPVDNNVCEDLGYDYILVLDTEGLRAPELGESKLNHDNELATLVIGLGDVTIVNIKGENTSEIEDILQICVHAFLRMQLTNESLKLQPGCYFVHQNVPAVDADEKTSYGYKKILEKLDVIAKAAAKQEGARDIQSFKDVIDFDVTKNVWYFSSLWQGDPPMAPANPSYSKKVLDLKTNLLNYPSLKKINCLTFSDLQLRISDLWKALLYENFVFSFKNSLEVNAYNNLEIKYSSLSWDFRNEMKRWTHGSINEILSCEEKNVGSLQGSIIRSLGKFIDENFVKYGKELNKFFTSSKEKDILIKWKSETEIRLKKLSEELKYEAKKTCLSHFEIRRAQFVKENQTDSYQKQLRVYVKELVSTNVNGEMSDESLKEMSEDSLKKLFDNKWSEWMKKLCFEQIEKKNIKEDVFNVLIDYFKTTIHLLQIEVPYYDSLEDELHEFVIYPNTDYKVKTSLMQKGLNVGKRFLGFDNKDMMEIRAFTDEMLNEIKRNIHENKHQDYDKTFLYDICNEVNRKVQRSNLNKHYELQINYSIKVTVRILKQVIPLLKTKHRQFREKNDPQRFLEENVKSQLENFFLGTVLQCMQEKTAADILSSYLEKAIVALVKRELPQVIADTIKHSKTEFHTKSNLYTKVLEYLGKEKSFDKYIVFIENPNEAMNNWLEMFVSNYCTVKTNGSSNLGNEANEILLNAVKTLKKSAKTVNASVDTKGISFQGWLLKYQELVKRTVPLQNKIFENLDLKEVKDIEYFEERINLGLQSIQKTLESRFSKWCVEDLYNLEEEPHKLIAENILGCTERCPFCFAICTHTTPGHAVSHSNPNHRPAGISGRISGTTHQLRLESCNVLVAGDIKFISNDGGSHFYKEYAKAGTEYLSWSIGPDTSIEGSTYWKWVFCKFGTQLAEHAISTYSNLYKVTCPEIPKSWRSLNWEDAKKSIGKSV